MSLIWVVLGFLCFSRSFPRFLFSLITKIAIQEQYINQRNILTLENNSIGHGYTILDARHYNPICTLWEKKENEPEFMQWQKGYRVVDNLLRLVISWFSYLVTLITIIWCILGLFIFPERFGPYTTGMFVIIANGRVLYIRMTSYFGKIKELIQEGLRHEKMESLVPECLQFFTNFLSIYSYFYINK